MKKFFSGLKIYHKTIGLCVLVVILFSCLLFFYFMPAMRESLIDRKKEMIRELGVTAMGILGHYHNMHVAGTMTVDEAKRGAVEAIKNLRYGPDGKDYFWINDMQPVMVMHPYRPDLDGKDVSGFADPKGTRLFVEMVNVCRRDGKGYVNYMWQWKDDASKIVPKISYAVLFEPWGWVLGTGIYIEDVNAEITAFMLRMAAWAAGIILVALVLGLVIGRNVNGIIGSIIGETKRLLDSASAGNLSERGDPSKVNFEFRGIIDGINSILEAVISPLKVAADYVSKISKGEIPEKIVAEYKGDFNEVKANLNTMIDRTGAQVQNLANLPTPLLTIDKDFNITFINNVGASLAGLTPMECEGKKCYDLFKTRHCRSAECRTQQAMQRDEAVTGETTASPNGAAIPIRYTAAPIRDRGGKVIGALEFIVDMTETRRLMDDSEEKVRYLNNIPTPVLAVDREMNILFMNENGAAVAGKSQDACRGVKCYNLFNTSHCNTAECSVMKAMKFDGVFTGNTIAKLPDGELPIRYTGAPLKDAAGNIVGGLEYVTEIIEEHKAVAEVNELIEAATRGVLTKRGNPDNYKIAGFRNVIQGINNTLDAIINLSLS